MAEQASSPTGETTESLLKKLCFHLAENKQDIADHFYSCMRSFLLVGHTKKISKSTSNLTSLHELTNALSTSSLKSDSGSNGEYLFDYNKIVNFLSSVDADKALEFRRLINKIEYDESPVLSNKKSSLTFLMNMAKRNETSTETVLVKRQSIHLSNCKPALPSKPSLEKLYPMNRESPEKDVSSSRLEALKNLPNIVNGRVNSHPQNQISAIFKKRAESTAISGTRDPPDSGFSGSQSFINQSRSVTNSNRLNAYSTKIPDASENSLSEWDLIQGIIFTWQSVEGNVFQFNLSSHRYGVYEKFSLERTVREKAENLTWLGYLHDSLHKYSTGTTHEGLVQKHLAAYIRDHLSDYYSLVANIQTQFKEEVNDENNRLKPRKSLVTLERLKLLSLRPMKTFQDLISILEFCHNCKGGYLASTVYCFLQHGDPDLQDLVKGILSEICKPLYAMLTNWLLDGEICDPYKEFFIGTNNNIGGDMLWYEKYKVRKAMLPVFISEQLANKILSVGKSINFLREICGDESPFSDRDKLKEMFANTSVDVMYLLEREDEMQQLIDLVYKHTSKRVMDVLINKYSLMTHFQAHKKYLLLGQGDFIHHFMELIFTHLDKPADQIYPHQLNSFLETAIRASTAQHEDEDILKRLDTGTMVYSQGDCGWDIFYLRYHVTGPIGTVFGLSKKSYQVLFYALWKAKRIEMVLSQLWRKQTISAKFFRIIKELSPTVQQCNTLTSEMIHFINQIQYYFLFEVLECCWNELINETDQADNLDEVISAHDHFLQTVLAGVFKSPHHVNLYNQLQVVYDLILQLEEHVESLVNQSQKEVHERSLITDEQDKDYVMRRKEFTTKFVPSIHASLKLLAKVYGDTVKKFVLTLNSQEDLNLQPLSIRLDFNEHYKSLDSRLIAPLTFQHRRMSSIGGTNSYNSSPVLSRKALGRSTTPEVVSGAVPKHYK